MSQITHHLAGTSQVLWLSRHFCVDFDTQTALLSYVTYEDNFFFLPSSLWRSTKSRRLLQKMAPCDTLVVAGHFYSDCYEADSSGSASHKCITVNHNIPCHPCHVTAWHHCFPSKNTAFKKVREGVSSTQHRRLTWDPFTELRFRADSCLLLCLEGSQYCCEFGKSWLAD